MTKNEEMRITSLMSELAALGKRAAKKMEELESMGIQFGEYTIKTNNQTIYIREGMEKVEEAMKPHGAEFKRDRWSFGYGTEYRKVETNIFDTKIVEMKTVKYV